MTAALDRIEQWYFRYRDHLTRLLMGAVVGFFMADVISNNPYGLPPGWVKIVPVVLMGLFLTGERLGVLGTVALLFWMLYNTWSLLGLLFGTSSIFSLWLIYAVGGSIARRLFNINANFQNSGQITLILLSPFLVNSNLGFVVPLAAGLNWGGGGVQVAVIGAIVTTIVFMLGGFNFWAFPLSGGQSILGLTIPGQENPIQGILSGLPPDLQGLLQPLTPTLASISGELLSRLAPYIALAAVKSFVMSLVGRELLGKPLLILQIILWGSVAFAMSLVTHNRNSLASRLQAVGVGVMLLAGGYYLLPILADAPYVQRWPGGAVLFWYYLVVSAAMVLLPQLIITGRLAPGPVPQPVVLMNQPGVLPQTALASGPQSLTQQESQTKAEDQDNQRIRKIELQ